MLPINAGKNVKPLPPLDPATDGKSKARMELDGIKGEYCRHSSGRSTHTDRKDCRIKQRLF